MKCGVAISNDVYLFIYCFIAQVPDHLVDSCKCSSVNWMAVGSRLPTYLEMSA